MTTATTAPQPVLAPGTLPRLSAADCTPTPWASSQHKAEAGNRLLAFVESGLPQEAFTAGLYKSCSQHLFGHIAHFNRHGFAAEWFTTPHDKAAFIEHALHAACTGDPAYTWSDVEQHIQSALEAHPHLLDPATWLGIQRPHPCPSCCCTP